MQDQKCPIFLLSPDCWDGALSGLKPMQLLPRDGTYSSDPSDDEGNPQREVSSDRLNFEALRVRV